MPKQILILFAHPAVHNSRVNKAMVDAIADLEHVVIHDLYETYPDFYINIKKEQSALKQADLVVFHHPFFWYGPPPMVKLWQDVVLTRGFAYGINGSMLHNKDFMLAISTGGKEQAYQREGNNHFTIDELLFPYQAMSYRCGLQYHSPFVIHGSYNLSNEDILAHADRFRNLLVQYGEAGATALFANQKGGKFYG